MSEIKLNSNEINVLIKTLNSYLSDLRMEIADTDSMKFRQMLKDKKETLMGILAKLEEKTKQVAA